jgi:hypothetical protein
VDAVNDSAPTFPAVRCVIVGTPGAAKNVTAVDGSSQAGIKSQVATLVATAATAAEHR